VQNSTPSTSRNWQQIIKEFAGKVQHEEREKRCGTDLKKRMFFIDTSARISEEDLREFYEEIKKIHRRELRRKIMRWLLLGSLVLGALLLNGCSLHPHTIQVRPAIKMDSIAITPAEEDINATRTQERAP